MSTTTHAPPDDDLVILLLAASPDRVAQLRVDREVRQIHDRLLAARYGRSVTVYVRWAVRPDDLQQALLEYRPHIVHYSGHASERYGILLEDVAGEIVPVGHDVLADLFGILRDRIQLVVLNACESLPHARAITAHIDAAIGMSEPIADDTAIEFAAAFYQGIAFGRALGVAFDLGRHAVRLKGLDGAETPALLTRDGVDPATTVLLDRVDLGGARGAAAVAHRDAGARRPVAATDAPADLLGAAAEALAAACPDDAAFAALLSGAGVSPGRIPALPSMQARCECLLLDLAGASDPAGFEALAGALVRLGARGSAAAEQVRCLAAAVDGDRWPESLEAVWLALHRRGDGWMLEFRAPLLRRAGAAGSARSARVPVASGAAVQVEVRETGVALRLQAGLESPLLGLKARVWTGVRGLSKRLVPWFDERLGPADPDELTLLETTTTWRELDAA
ncbi:CHAT domain-containing protein [Sorangium sp. So ce118]